MDISSGIEANFSGRVAKKILSTLPLLPTLGISYRIEPLTEAYLAKFLPLYEANIGGKQNALMQDVRGKTLNNTASTFPYFSISLFENEVFMGGAIFSLRTDRISYAYRTYINEWTKAKLQAGPALIGEYAVASFACEKDLAFVSHGKDRNPYGLNASIGLAAFKISVGCRPSIGGEYEIKTLDTNTLTEDCLILELPKEGTSITKAYLVTLRENEQKHLRVTKYPDSLQVEVLYRD
jgi:hypothetical protein